MVPNIEKYLPKRPGETAVQYQARVDIFAYTPVLMSEIRELVDRLVASPVSAQVEASYYEPWTKDTNGLGRPVAELHDRSLTTSLLYGGCYWGIVPPSDLADSLAEDDKPPRVHLYSPLEVIRQGPGWYVTRETVELQGAIEKPRTVERIITWLPNETVVYEVELVPDADGFLIAKGTEKGKDPDIKPLPFVPHGQGKPAMVALKLPDKQSIGLAAYLKQLQHLRVENAWTFNATQAGQIQRLYTPAQVQADDPRRIPADTDYSEYKFDGSDVLVGGSYAYVEAEGKALINLGTVLDKLEEQIQALVSKSFSSNGVLGQSGLSKSIDQIALNDSLKSYGLKYLAGWEALLNRVDKVMGYDGEIRCTGMSDYSSDSLDELLDKTDRVIGVSDYLSPLCLERWMARIQAALHPGINPDDLQAMEETLPKWEAGDLQADLGIADLEALAEATGLSVEEVQAAMGVTDG
jgi:hypothetical protein